MSLFKVSKSLLDSISNIIKDDRVTYAKEQAKINKKVASKLMNEAKTHTVPKTDKEKKLAALAEPKDKITHADVMTGRGVKMKEELSSKEKMKRGMYNKEETDTPGNGREHQCAIHVKSEQFGEGKTIFSQHADPDAEGNIEWYDVMFEHGIEKQVLTKDLEVLVSESHMSHKKKKGM
jgi:hypothetical protein